MIDKKVKRLLLMFVIVIILTPIILLNKSKIGVFNELQASTLLSYIGTISGSVAALFSIYITIDTRIKREKPLLRMDDFFVCKSDSINYLLDFIINIDKNDYNNLEKEYITFNIYNRGKIDASSINFEVIPKTSNSHHIEIETDMKDVDVLPVSDKIRCAIRCYYDVGNTNIENNKLEFILKYTYNDSFNNEYEMNYLFILLIDNSNKQRKLSIEEIKYINNNQ